MLSISHKASVFIDLSQRVASPEGVTQGTRLFQQLATVDRDAVHIVVADDSQDRKKLEDLVWMIGEAKYDGILFVLLPESETGERLTSRFMTISGWSMVAIEQVNQSADRFFSRFRIENALGLANRHAERDRASVVFFVEQPSLFGTVSSLKIVSNVKLAPSEIANEDLFQTLLAPRMYDLVPVGVKAIGSLVKPEGFFRGCGDYALNLVDRYNAWLHQEFETETCAEAALELLGRVFGSEGSRNDHVACLPRSWQIAIGSIRLARQMASWTLEGEAFRCSVLLMSGTSYQRLIKNERIPLTRVLNFNDSIPFHLENKNDVRDMAELAQADDLFLIVNAADGCLHLIAGPQSQNEKESRHLRYARLAKKSNALLLHVRDAFVEVYGAGRLWLWHDRFQWVVKPFETLRSALKDHFGARSSDDDDDDPKSDPIDIMVGAIASLMDQHQDSIIILLHDGDVRTFDAAISALRPGVAVSGYLEVSGMPLETLTSILHIDGAHAVRHDGRLSHLAMRISVPAESAASEPSESRVLRSRFTGTGTRAAEELSHLLKKSCVIKVSASGYIKFFDEQRRYRSDTSETAPFSARGDSEA